jgi:DNA-directed RNA polymerase sigma subunit (sigma70/sigma32)
MVYSLCEWMIRTRVMYDSIISQCVSKGIPEREIMVVLDRIRGVTLAEIARDEGVSPERIRQIEARGLRRMKQKGVVVIANME